MATLVEDLNQLLADYQVLYHKVRNFHWNVRGEHFFQLHAEFETLYTALALRVDEIAERILALGGSPTGSMAVWLETSRLEEARTELSSRDMVAALAHDLETVNGYLAATIEKGEAASDRPTVNLLDAFSDAQAQTLWMFRSFLGGVPAR